MGSGESERGSASVEQAGLAALIALLLVAAIAAVAADGEIDGGQDFARVLGRRITCAPRLPDACHHHPLVPAYGWPLARLARALAPAPTSRIGPAGLPLIPVDFRHCRSESCAAPASPGGRPTAFTSIRDERRALGWVELTYWMYRPSIGWERVVRRATAADIEAAAGISVLLEGRPDARPTRDHVGPRSVRVPSRRAAAVAMEDREPLPGAGRADPRVQALPGLTADLAPSPPFSPPSWASSSSACLIRPRQSVVRKTSTITANPRATDQAAIAI